MYAIRLAGAVLPGRFDSFGEAAEHAQEALALPPESLWTVVVANADGTWGETN